MAANTVEELENKIGIEMKAVRALMLDRFSFVDQKLTVIEELLKKLVDTKNQTGNQPETGNSYYGSQIENGMGERGIVTSKSRDEGSKVIGGHDGVHSHERRVKIKLENSRQGTDDGFHLDDRGREGSPWEGNNPYGWVGLYTSHHDKDNLPWPDFGMRNNFCGSVLAGQQELGVRTKNMSSFGFRYRPKESSAKSKFDNFFIDNRPRTQRGTGQDGLGQKMVKDDETEWVEKQSENETEKGWGSWVNKDVKKGQYNLVKDSLMSDEWRAKDSWADSSGKVPDKMDASGEKEEHTGSWAPWRKKKDDKTDVPEQSSSTADMSGKKDHGSQSKVHNERHGKWLPSGSDRGHVWIKKVEEKTDTKDGWGPWVKKCNNRPHSQMAAKRSNEKGYKVSQKPGSCNENEEVWGPKRKRPNSPVGEPTDASRSNRLFTATWQRFDMFTSDEQEILNDFDPIVHSVQRIMHDNGYNDGDPLSPDDQTYILDNLLNYHPGKAQKMGAGIDYIMVCNHLKFPGSRCFYIVTTDGRKEDFSYRKCLESFLRGKYPDKANAFMRKYFKPKPQLHPAGNRGHG
uniref:DNA-directed RNA polymerase V subunit 1-like n=1 Tax=Erigeron canadensis TaxID=72917 RepID=UPI001CB8ACEB|nr:DNA-directed RNA polymerase V subunit 1-like [Erigeron canadensis]XP_043618669.1 DNA-directed RNA polymerase V subunit 1-like [Erigeron canadensis]